MTETSARHVSDSPRSERRSVAGRAVAAQQRTERRRTLTHAIVGRGILDPPTRRGARTPKGSITVLVTQPDP
eukprot:1637499-Prymnesium_polylepis.1